MHSKVAPYAATPDSTYGHQTPTSAHSTHADADQGEAAKDAELRLVIEEDPETGVIVYKRIDRLAGRVVAAYSRDEVLKMREDAGYVAGEVIRTRA